MNHAFSLIQGAAGGSGGALRVLGAGYPGRVGLARAGAATAFDEAGLLQHCAEHAPRFSGPARRLLVEEARSNGLRNPRAEGAVAGTPGTLPTFWRRNAVHGIGIEIVGSGIDSGLPYLDARFSGTATASASSVNLGPDQTTATAASTGQTWTMSCFVRLLAGTLGANRLQLQLAEFGTNGYLAASSTAVNPGAGPLRGQRVVLTRSLGASGTAYVSPLLYLVYSSGEAVDFTLRVAMPQLELGGTATSPILPPAGAPAVAFRAADQPLWFPPDGFGSQGTVVVRALLPQAAPFGASQGLWQIDDGTDANRIQLRNTSAGSAITGVVDLAGATQATLAAGNMAAGVPFRAAFSWAPGDQALCLSGGTPQLAAASLPGGLARMLIGHGSVQFNRAANGEVELVDYRPTRVSNSLLQALANAG